MSKYIDEVDKYPTEEQLEKVKHWNPEDFIGLMEYIKSLWAFRAWGWHQKGNVYEISTGGWSGNEEIISAMQDNIIVWAFYWEQSRRGGHYIFSKIGDDL